MGESVARWATVSVKWAKAPVLAHGVSILLTLARTDKVPLLTKCGQHFAALCSTSADRVHTGEID
jgi:hypothetical protein